MRRIYTTILAIGFLFVFGTQCSGNQAPVAVEDYVTTPMNTPITFNVLDNDHDPDPGDEIGIEVFKDPDHGMYHHFTDDGLIVDYKPDEGFVGTDSMAYMCIDSGGLSSSATVTITVTAVEPPEIDLTISGIKPVQVVWNSDVDGDGVNDLVAGKSTAVLVDVGMQDYQGLDEEEEVSIRLSFDGSYYTTVRPIGLLEEDNRIVFYPGPPTTMGNQVIIAEVDAPNDILETNENNNDRVVEITVKETSSLHLVYVPVDSRLGKYGPIDLTEYSDTVTHSDTFIQAVYPIAGGKYISEEIRAKHEGSPIRTLGIITDLAGIWLQAQLLTLTSADRAVGIVPDDYFDYHEKPAGGAAFPGIPAALVVVDNWTVAAHEIGHTYGLYLDQLAGGPGEEYEINPSGNRTEGFWVSKGKEILNGWCFMGSRYSKGSFVYDDGNPVWIEDKDYVDLFKIFRIDKTDPPNVLLMNGIIFKDGTVRMGKLYMLENGISDNITPGDYSVLILDAGGQILSDISFFTAFYAHFDFTGIVETDYAGFAFVISYPENASRIQIQHNGQTLTEFNPNCKLLHDAVDSIPEYGFVGNAEQRLKALHKKIDEIEAKIGNNEIQDAMNKLKFDVRDKLEKWLVDGYQPQNPLQLSKGEVIELVDNIVGRLRVLQP
ncbi:MAG: Ig-like domain-containing protein [Planctomycetota bacterium]|jgi:hypothetical protein